MIYTLECKECGAALEVMQMMNDEDVVVVCEGCEAPMTRRTHRLWGADRYALQTNCTLGVSYDYMDPTLGKVNSKQHRKDLMKIKGVEEHSTDPDVKKHIDDAQYIRSRSRTGDAEATAEAKKCVKAAAKVQREKNIDAAFRRADVG